MIQVEPVSQPLTFSHSSTKGVLTVRSVLPIKIYYGTSPEFEEPEWLLYGFDLSEKDARHFALKHCNFSLTSEMTPADWFGSICDAVEHQRNDTRPIDEWAQENPVFQEAV